MSITRTPIVDDNGTGMTGTVLDDAWKQELYNQIDAADTALSAAASATVRTETATGNIVSLTLPTGTGSLVVYMNNATLATIQGIAAGLDGQDLTLISKGAGQVNLSHEDLAATAAKRLTNFVTNGKTPLAPAVGAAVLKYDATASRWRLITHDQGAWISPAYAAGNFTGSGGWTVDAGDISTMAFFLRNRAITVAWYMGATTVVAGTNLNINNGAWGGFTVAKNMLAAAAMNENGTGNALCLTNVSAAGTLILLLKTGGANFLAATNNSSFFGEITFEIQ